MSFVKTNIGISIHLHLLCVGTTNSSALNIRVPLSWHTDQTLASDDVIIYLYIPFHEAILASEYALIM